MRAKSYRSLSLEPLVTFLTVYHEPDPYDGHQSTDAHSIKALAELCNVDRQSFYRWQQRGELPWFTADSIAIAIGTHPVLIWGDEWLELADARTY